MSLNHHILAKVATDEVLSKFKKNEWKCAGGLGQEFYRVGTSADFPSPDAAFFDPTNKLIISFEFKPPTETKRGILTGVGQSIAYLQDSNISYLIAPKMLGNYNIGNYLSNLYNKHINTKLPVGLILYDNNEPLNMILAQNVDKLDDANAEYKMPKAERFWAKHVDLPIPLFHLILHYYYRNSTSRTEADPFAMCWQEKMISSTLTDDFQTMPIYDLSGKVIKTVTGKKNLVYFEKKIPKLKGTHSEKQELLKQEISTTTTGDNYYNSIKKNLVTFLKHLHMIDSGNRLTERGFNLYHLGLVNEPTSKIFTDYFTKELLTVGHHLDLILDFDSIKQKKTSADIEEIISTMEEEYENKGYIKRNPNRMSCDESNVKFLKYEKIIWKALDLMDKNYTINWRKITEICSLKDI